VVVPAGLRAYPRTGRPIFADDGVVSPCSAFDSHTRGLLLVEFATHDLPDVASSVKESKDSDILPLDPVGRDIGPYDEAAQAWRDILAGFARERNIGHASSPRRGIGRRVGPPP
jgi:hypothetical protein